MHKPRLRVIQSKPGFDLRRFMTGPQKETKVVGRRRPPKRMTMKFVRLPYTWGRRLHKHRVNAAGWYLLGELDRLIHEPGKGNPVTLTTEVLKSMDLSR